MKVLKILLSSIFLASCVPVAKTPQVDLVPKKDIAEVLADWRFLALPETPFSLPMPVASTIDSDGVISSMPYKMINRDNQDEAFLFTFYKSEDWSGSVAEYKNQLQQTYDICEFMPECDSNGVHIVSFVRPCGVTCEEQRVFYKGKIYSFKDGCDLTEKARELKRLAFCNIRPIE